MIRRLAPLALLLIAAAAHAQEEKPVVTLDQVKSGMLLIKTNQSGFYVPAPALETNVALHIRGIVARGEVTQRFRNAEAMCVEAVYVFPLPDDAAVDTLRMTIGNRVIEGDIQERKKAEEVYEQAKSEGRKATLLSQERPNIFTASIANLGAGEEIVITIAYQQTVEYRDGTFRLRFPMTMGPRYVPDSVADAARIMTKFFGPNEPRRNRLNLTVDLDAGTPLRRLDSSYQKVETTTVAATRYNIELRDTYADRDFELVWQPDLGTEPRSAVFTEDGYALLMVMPPAATGGTRMPRDTIYIIDTSGSMAGMSLNQAKAALQMALDRLEGGDRFNVIEFNSITRALFNDAQPATPQAVAQAKRWVQDLQSNGGTEMMPALDAALRDDASGDAVRQIIFITDGQAGNENECFSLIRSKLGRSRLFTIGIGSAPNSHFMREAARFGRGTFTYIGTINEVQEKMTVLFQKLESPVMTDVELRFDDPTAEVWPQRVPDLYAGEPVVVAAKLGSMGGRAILSGKRGTEEWHQVQSLSNGSPAEAAHTSDANSAIGRLWARRKIDALSDNITPESQQQIVALALEHHLVTSFTSLVAVDKTPGVQQKCETRRVPVNLPTGWGGLDGSLPGTATPAPMLLIAGALLMGLAAVAALRS